MTTRSLLIELFLEHRIESRKEKLMELLNRKEMHVKRFIFVQVGKVTYFCISNAYGYMCEDLLWKTYQRRREKLGLDSQTVQ